MTARPYRLRPSRAAFLLFLAAGSLMLDRIMGREIPMTPQEEMQAVRYALAYPSIPPAELRALDLEELLGRLDGGLRPIAERVTIVSYSSSRESFLLKATHAGEPGRAFTVDLYGVR